MKLRIGHLSTFYHTAVLLQARPDLTERLGVDIEWRLMGTGPAIMQAFGKGELDLAYVGLPPAIIAMEQGAQVVCVAGGHMEGTVMCGKARWKGYPAEKDLGVVLAQFRGRTIGVPGSGSIHDVILRDSIARLGLERDIAVMNYAWADLVTEAVVHDEVAAAFGTPALAVAIRRFADGAVLFPPSLIWPNNPSYGIVVSRRFLADHRSTVRDFVALHEEACGLLRDDPSGAAASIADAVGIVDADFVHETLLISPRYCAQLTGDYIASTMGLARVLLQRGFVRRELNSGEIFDRTLIDEVHPGPDHYHSG